MFVVKICKFGTELVINLPRALIKQLDLKRRDYLVLDVKSDKTIEVNLLEKVLAERRELIELKNSSSPN